MLLVQHILYVDWQRKVHTTCTAFSCQGKVLVAHSALLSAGCQEGGYRATIIIKGWHIVLDIQWSFSTCMDTLSAAVGSL